MKSAKQIVFICIGAAMILLGVGLIFMKKSNDTVRGVSSKGESGSEVFSAPITSLVFEAGACSVEIQAGDGEDFLLEYEGLKYGTLTHELEDEKLKISFKLDNNWTAKMFVEKDIDDQKITLTVPEDVILDSALFEFGAAEVRMDQVATKELYVTVGAGTLHAKGLTATELAKLNVGAGAFYADNVTLANAELVCGVGEMGISKDTKGTAVPFFYLSKKELELKKMLETIVDKYNYIRYNV